uniref:Elongation of fatty acids protein n=1 Tax=Pseudictyota dubia TaxID=2749911 RepID=A0A7R9ZHM8_9STRA|mmetsp:Transcript_50454/g.93250  ORF Transcript_50454/g.93250 Transcript_50454/m.93250 type:complete len:142 (+) Transcript_50454:34-459(+)
MSAYVETMDSIGESILSWADPEGKFRGHTEGWFLTDFSSAGTVALAYVAFVVIGSAVMKSGVAAMDPYPIKFIYNVSQIMLCAYMTIEAFLLAYRNGYTCLPCNNVDTENPPLANLLWLFYISKVWDFWDTVFIVIGRAHV